MNADTIDMWRRLEADDELRNAMVRRAEATVAALDTTLADSAVAAQPGNPNRVWTVNRDNSSVAVVDVSVVSAVSDGISGLSRNPQTGALTPIAPTVTA